jgi:hypothetical protein
MWILNLVSLVISFSNMSPYNETPCLIHRQLHSQARPRLTKCLILGVVNELS